MLLFANSMTAHAAPNDDDTCTFHDTNLAAGTANARLGGALVQIRSSGKRDDPYDMAGQQGIALSTRMTTMEARVAELETTSGHGREDLKNQLTMLTDTVAVLKSGGAGSLEDTISRVSSAEGQTSTLAATRSTDKTEVRAEIEALKERYEALSNRVGRLMQAKSGQHASPSLFQSQAGAAGLPARKHRHSSSALHNVHQAEDPPPAAAASAPTGPLLGRCQALEDRVGALEATSGEERDALANELDALIKEVETISAGGSGSLEHTIARQGSAEKELATLQNTHESDTVDMNEEMKALEAKLNTISKTLGGVASGAALLQKTAADPAALSLGTRMDALQQRIGQLEDKSGDGRKELQLKLSDLSAKVDKMKAGGASSLHHTTVRITETEKELGRLESTVTSDKSALLTTVEALKAKLTALEEHVGAGR